MAGSVSRDLMLFLVTKNRWNVKKKEAIEAKTFKVLKECLWFKNYQQRNVFTTNRGSNEKLSLKLAVPEFQKWSFQIIFPETYLFGNTISFKKPVAKLGFNDVAGLKKWTPPNKEISL